MVIMPYSHDQPDNARRMRRLGVAKIIQRKNYTAEKAARVIRKMLDDPGYRERASVLSKQISGEEALRSACDALEQAARKQ